MAVLPVSTTKKKQSNILLEKHMLVFFHQAISTDLELIQYYFEQCCSSHRSIGFPIW